MTAEEPLIDLFIQPAKHPYFVKEKSFWTVDRAANLAQRSRSCAQHSRSFACQLPSEGRSPRGDKPVDNESLPSRLFSVSSDGVCTARAHPQAMVAADDRLRVTGSSSKPVVQAQQTAEHRSPWPQLCRELPFLGGSGPSVMRDALAASGEEEKELRCGELAGEPRAAVATTTVAATAGSSAETVGAATVASTSGSNNLAFLTESIRRKKNSWWRPHSPVNGRENIKLLSGRGSPLAADDTGVVATTRRAFYNAGYDAWPDDECIAACRSPHYVDVECATEASESGTGCTANARHETGTFVFRRPSTSSVETTGAPGTRDTVSLSGSSCHEDDIQPLSLVLHIAAEPYVSGSDVDCVASGGGSSSTGVGLPSLTRRLFARHKRDGSGRSGSSSSGGRTGCGPSRYHRDSGRSAAATVVGVAPSRAKPSASKSSRDAAGCGSDRTAANCSDGLDSDLAANLTPSVTSSISAASCWQTPSQSLSPSFVPFSSSARTTLLRSRSRSPSSYSCSSSRLLSDRVATDAATAFGAVGTPPRNPSYGSIDSFVYGMPPTLHSGASSSWHQQRQQHHAESSFFDVVVAEPATVCSSRQAHLPIRCPGGATAASFDAPAARQSIVLRHLEQFDFEEADDDDFRGDRGSRVIGARKMERRRRQRRVLIAVAVVLAFTLTVGAVTACLLAFGPHSSRGFSYLFHNGSSTSTTEHSIPSTSPPNQARYVGTILLKIEYTPDMADLRSVTARNLTNHFCDTVKNMYSEHNSTNMIYDNCEVTKLERGSVKITFKITFTSKSCSSTLNDNETANRLRRILEDEIKTSKFGLFPCDVTNFSMELEHGEPVQSQEPTVFSRPGTAADDDVRLDRLVSEANLWTATSLSDTSTNIVSADRDGSELPDMTRHLGVDDADWSAAAAAVAAAASTSEASSTHPAVLRYLLTIDRDKTALHLTETTNMQRLLDDSTMRRRFGLTPAYDSTATAAAASLTIVAAADTTRSSQPLDSQSPIIGPDQMTPTMMTSRPSASATHADFAATSAAAASITAGLQQLPDVTEQLVKWLHAETVTVTKQSAVVAVTSDREEASAGQAQTHPHSSGGASLAPTFESSAAAAAALAQAATAGAAAGGAAMTSEPSELPTSDLTSSALTDSGRQLSTQSALTATVLPTMQAPAVFSPMTPAVAARMSGPPETTSHETVLANGVAAAAATAASIEPILTVTSTTSMETSRPAFELLSESRVTWPATYRVYERTSAREHVTSVTFSGSSDDGFSQMSSVLPTSKPDHTGDDAVSAMPPLPVQHASSATVWLHPSDDASAAPFGTSMSSTFADRVQAYGSATDGMPEMYTADSATQSSEVLSWSTSSSSLLDTVDVYTHAQNVISSVTLQSGGTSVPIVSSARTKVMISPPTSEPRPRSNDSSTSSAAATLAILETSVLTSQPASGAHASSTDVRMATASSTLTSSALALSVTSTTLLNRLTAGVTLGTSASLAVSTNGENARASLSATSSVGGVLPAAYAKNGSDSAITPLPTLERAAAASTSDGSTALPALGSTSSAEESTNGAAISNVTHRFYFGCGMNESYVQPSPGNCLAYEVCLSGDLRNFSCVAGYYFEPLRNICVPCNVLKCNKCPISRMERAGDSGTARAVAAALPIGSRKSDFQTSTAAHGVPSGRQFGSAATPTSTVDMATTIVTILRLARTSPVPDFAPAMRPAVVTGSLFIASVASALPQEAAAGHVSEALPKPISPRPPPPPQHAVHVLTTAGVQSSSTPNAVAAATVTGGNSDRHTALTTAQSLSFVTGENTAEQTDFAGAAGSADQQQSLVAHASRCSSNGMGIDPNDCTAMIFCLIDGSVAREPCPENEMFSVLDGECVACDITMCSKCGPST